MNREKIHELRDMMQCRWLYLRTYLENVILLDTGHISNISFFNNLIYVKFVVLIAGDLNITGM